MDLRKLGYLQQVIAHGSFAAAGRAAGVSQPAITQAMRALEREAGVPLFERVGRRKRPTPAALRIAQRASVLQMGLRDLAGGEGPWPAGWPRDDADGALRISMAPTAGLLYGHVVEQAWRAQQPDGVLHIIGHAPDMLAALQRGELDLVLAPRPRGHEAPGLRRRLLFTSTPTICARAGHPLAGAYTLREIAGAGWAAAGRVGTAGSTIEEALRVRHLPPPRILLEANDYMTLLALVARTDLLCTIPHPALLDAIAHPGVVPLRVREGLPRYEVCVFWSAEAARGVRAVVRALQLAAQAS